MLAIKSIKVTILGSFISVLLIGCSRGNFDFTKLFSSPTNPDEMIESSNNPDTSTLTIEQAYEELDTEYKNFAKYIYNLKQDTGKPVNKGGNVIDVSQTLQGENSPALGILTQKLEQQQAATADNITPSEDQIWTNAYQTFQDLKTANQNFPQDNPTIKSPLESITAAITELDKYMEKLKDGALSRDDIQELQGILNLNKSGILTENIAQKINQALIDQTIKISNSLSQIGEYLTPSSSTLESITDNSQLQQQLERQQREFQNQLNTEIRQLQQQLERQQKEFQNQLRQERLISLIIFFGFIATGFLLWYFWLRRINQQVTQTRFNQQDEKITTGQFQLSEQDEEIKTLQKKIVDLGKLIEQEFLALDTRMKGFESKLDDSQISSGLELSKTSSLSSAEKNAPNTSRDSDVKQEPDYISLVKAYRSNPNSFVQQATKVRMTTETTNKVLDGTWNNEVHLEKHRTGEYSIISHNNQDDYVFLDLNTKFNPQTLQIINKSKLFVCHGNLSNTVKGEDIEVNKPAKVRLNGNYWTLVESGELTL
jgi:hypothetical protein